MWSSETFNLGMYKTTRGRNTEDQNRHFYRPESESQNKIAGYYLAETSTPIDSRI
jgi:hypothetical protein